MAPKLTVAGGKRPMDHRHRLLAGKLGGGQFLFGAPLIIA
jgi:hypothetical protein